jgi:hypothetical protein
MVCCAKLSDVMPARVATSRMTALISIALHRRRCPAKRRRSPDFNVAFGSEQALAPTLYCRKALIVRYSPILLKNSDLGEARNFACPLNRIAHHRHEGIAADAEKSRPGASQRVRAGF